MAISKKNRLETNTITQIGFVVRDIETATKDYAHFFGVNPPKISITAPGSETHAEYRGKPTEGQAKLAFFSFKNISLELIQPVGGPSTWQEFLDTKGEGVHHIAFHVNNSEQKAADLTKEGIELQQKGDFPGGCYKYLDTTKTLKILLELLQ